MRLGGENKKQVLLVPVSFVSDHIETLFELEMEYRAVAAGAGIENYVVCKDSMIRICLPRVKDIALNAWIGGNLAYATQAPPA